MPKQTLLRRDFLKLGIVAVTGAAFLKAMPFAFAADDIGKVVKTNSEWKKILTSAQYDVLREEGTERPFTSDLLNEHREGLFACVGCDLPLFESKTKFDSGTGWPSFYDSIKGHIEMKEDKTLFMTRTEYHCTRCGGHHGHVFDDGPPPTGLRHCNNGVVLKFIAKGA